MYFEGRIEITRHQTILVYKLSVGLDTGYALLDHRRALEADFYIAGRLETVFDKEKFFHYPVSVPE